MRDLIKRSDALNFRGTIVAKDGSEDAIERAFSAFIRHIKELPSVDETEDTGDYKTRMISEYYQLKERYTKLNKMLVKYEAGTLDFEPDCPIDLLKRQKRVMGEYLYVLEIRAEIEDIYLDAKEE